jgi:signal transduction histidine kinase
MMLEPAQRAGDAPRSDSEQHAPSGPTLPGTRLPAPTPEARLHAEREQWRLRRGVERQLHDGAALRISALTLQLGLLRHRPADGDLDTAIDGVQDELHAVLQELRDVAGKIYPPLLDEAGLGPALREVADRVDPSVRVDASDDRFGPAAEGAAYFAVVGCLEAVAGDGPSGTACLDVVVRREDDTLAVDVAGVELRHADAMLGAVRHLDGVIDVAGGPLVGTITVRIPCE